MKTDDQLLPPEAATPSSVPAVDRRSFLTRTTLGLASLGVLSATGACGTAGPNDDDTVSPPENTQQDSPEGVDSTTGSSNDTSSSTDTTDTSSSDTGTSDGNTSGNDTYDNNDTPGDQTCDQTTSDIEGPFYRDNPPHRTAIADGEAGTPLFIRGKVYNRDCTAVLTDAVVDVWQADNGGDYDNNSEAFRLRGQMQTNETGDYEFRSILPGKYLNGSSYRPRHIHYKVTYTSETADRVELITQLYFEGDESIPADPWASQAGSRVIPLVEADDGSMTGVFDIIIPV